MHTWQEIDMTRACAGDDCKSKVLQLTEALAGRPTLCVKKLFPELEVTASFEEHCVELIFTSNQGVDPPRW
jgi:hypothetical protein